MKKDKLSKYEREIVEAIERGEYIPVKNIEGEKRRLQKIAQIQFNEGKVSLKI